MIFILIGSKRNLLSDHVHSNYFKNYLVSNVLKKKAKKNSLDETNRKILSKFCLFLNFKV